MKALLVFAFLVLEARHCSWRIDDISTYLSNPKTDSIFYHHCHHCCRYSCGLKAKTMVEDGASFLDIDAVRTVSHLSLPGR
jgi:hypothetical protein